MLQYLRDYFTGLFFRPDKDFEPAIPNLPDNAKEVFFSSAASPKIHGYFLHAFGAPLGTIVHCHGNAGQVGDHVPLVQFIAEAGFNLLAFDYGGYGHSQGEPSPENIVLDAQAAVDYVFKHPDLGPANVALFGQSLGGAAAAGAMARDPRVKCLILEGTFTTYRHMAQETLLGKLLFPIRSHVVPDLGPLHDLKNIGKRPVLLVHGGKDDVVPIHFSERIHAAFPQNTTLLMLPHLAHLEGEEEEPMYRRTIQSFLKEYLG